MLQLRTQKTNGYGSISDMKANNVVREIIWFFALFTVFAIIRGQIIAQYQTQPLGDIGSIHEFLWSMRFGFIYMIALAALWWLGVTNRADALARLRNRFEQYTFIFSLVFDTAAALGILLIYFFFGNRGIYGVDGKEFYPLTCIFILPVVFAALMYIVPPVNIRKVIVPAKRSQCFALRILIGTAVSIAGIVLFTLNF